MLASMIGIDMAQQRPEQAVPLEYENAQRGIKACYFPGSGLGGTFLEYLFNGATGSDMGKDCIRTYTYIVKNFSEDYEIWMFGLSRGSYTVRCVAGMINNCGILKRRTASGVLDEEEIDELCEEVYQIYRSPYEEDHPKAGNMLDFKRRASYDIKTPVKFMGILDTVGSLGIPTLDGGIGLHYPKFYDQIISSTVEKVYHACSFHDRLWCFEPCRALRDPNVQAQNPNLEIHEKWFPGCHYDLGRQRFCFLRHGSNFIETAFGRLLNPLSNVIEPNHVLGDLVLKWMLTSIQTHDPTGQVIPDIDARIPGLLNSIKNATPEYCGSGDVYGPRMAEEIPIGRIWGFVASTANSMLSVLDKLLPSVRPGSAIQELSGVKFILDVLAATRDRRIPSPDAVLTLYTSESDEIGGQNIHDLGRMQRPANQGGYQSRTFERFKAYLRELGRPQSAESTPS